VIHSDAAVMKHSVTVGRYWQNQRTEITTKELAARWQEAERRVIQRVSIDFTEVLKMDEQTAGQPSIRKEKRRGSRFPVVVFVEAKWPVLVGTSKKLLKLWK